MLDVRCWMLDVRYSRTQQEAIYHIYLPCSACANARWETHTARSTIYVLIVGRSETQGTQVNMRSRCWLGTRSRSQANKAAGQWESHSLPINSICSKQRYGAIRGRWFVFSGTPSAQARPGQQRETTVCFWGTFGNCDVCPCTWWVADLIEVLDHCNARVSMAHPQKGEKNYIELRENFVFFSIVFSVFFSFSSFSWFWIFSSHFFAPVDNVFFFLLPSQYIRTSVCIYGQKSCIFTSLAAIKLEFGMYSFGFIFSIIFSIFTGF